MKIDTKFEYGEKIFFIHAAKVIESIVRGFKIENLKNQTIITYLCNDKEDCNVHIKVDSGIAYKSKEDLIKSL